MVRVESIRENITKDKKVVDLQVSTIEELPTLNQDINTIIVAAGSIAQVIQSGTFYTLDDNGTWYDSDGNAAN